MDNLAVLLLGICSVAVTKGRIIPDELPLPSTLESPPEAQEASMVLANQAKAAPLDLNDQVSHALDLVANLVGIIGNSVGGLTFELTGISLHDCSAYFKGKDVSQISCDEFLDDLSQCESLGHIKPLLKTAKQRYQKIKGRAASSRNPCRRY